MTSGDECRDHARGHFDHIPGIVAKMVVGRRLRISEPKIVPAHRETRVIRAVNQRRH